MDSSIPELVERLGSDEDGVRKMAVFKLQGSIGDPSFADIFIAEGGLARLRYLILHATGNTLAYSLTSFARLLEVDKGWDFVDQEVVERVVELIVTHPLVNILRGAMSILVSIVSHPHTDDDVSQSRGFGFRALKPAIAVYPQFLEMLVSRLSSADHALCANALQLINSLMRESITNEADLEWPRFIQKLQDLGVIRAVYSLMRGTAMQDHIHPLIEFQYLTKVLLRKWRDIPLDLEQPEHRRALKGIFLASSLERSHDKGAGSVEDIRRSKRHHPEKWRRLGFDSENPVMQFECTGFLGLMDLADYVRNNQDEFQKIIMEQSTRPVDQRCPIARASLSVTSILYDHFEVDKSEMEDVKTSLLIDSRSNIDSLFQPLLLHWTRLHVAGLHAFFRLWRTTGAEIRDYDKTVELVRVLLESIIANAPRAKDVQEVEEDIVNFDYGRLRELQMELLELTYEDVWGEHLRHMRGELYHEALHFVKEQRIRCLLRGDWFPTENTPELEAASKKTSWRFIQLSHNRRFLHFGDFEHRQKESPQLDVLSEKIELSIVSSVVSNVSKSSDDAFSPVKTKSCPNNSMKIAIHGHPEAAARMKGAQDAGHHRQVSKSTQGECVLLNLHPQSLSVAAEWLDGLLMLLNQQPITTETSKLIDLISDYGLKIRLLNVRFDDLAFVGQSPTVPSRVGLDNDYYYDVFGGS
ncbi:ELMO/CED-12 family protein [Aspergillus homomorphus CBS 101889]|uniref:Regulator of Rac1, required for phagocytosis and cell migration n=1 Tax=Aspergillus homomorphus (strain CBS 101889) TaxID=1450537 RepID=A0A395HHA6_ASPHC|nr:regulator of Rac1, required for phagocytosis and cell migration [Aspergillus homomorphus CBS 101889]RAL06879.1 regulator of Rac1, required for phagocytosis and cell migration [Aspergillus homomorphus CBS 101889]